MARAALRGIHKRFGDTQALRGASLELQPGEVHALLGENGAGKTTLVRVLYGLVSPDSGTIEIEGARLRPRGPRHALSLGVGLVHQHFMGVPALSVAENLLLGERGGWLLSRARARDEASALLREYGLDLDPDLPADRLGVAQQQRLEIVRALSRGARILVLDEPTAVLAPSEVEELLALLGRLRDEGRSLVLISHKLEEITRTCDRVTVLRAGETVATREVADLDARGLARLMVGDEPLEKGGARLVCGHIDTPGPKLVAEAVVDSDGHAQLVAHLYGGARKHHWPGIPLGLVGRVARVGSAESEAVALRLGFEGEDDFSFFVTEATDDKVVAIAASTKTKKGTPTLTFVRYLNERYGITAADLEAAELYLVPAWPAREVGVDRALIGAHGQDDRANSYAAWRALIDVGAADQPPKHTAIAWLVDREEVGSTGRTGARSRFLELAYAWLLRAEGARADERTLLRAFAASSALSTDTPASLNPNFPEPHIERLAAHLGEGPVMFPYAGRNGKQGSHTARAEIIREALDVFEAAGVPMQTAELGKVDVGGGGTISKYMAERGMDVLDIGISIVAMHSPMELTAKQDIWWGYLGFKAWMQQ